MKPALLTTFALCLAAPAAAQTGGTAGFAGRIVHTTEFMGASVSTLDARVARRAWHSDLLDYAMARTHPDAWRAVVVEYR